MALSSIAMDEAVDRQRAPALVLALLLAAAVISCFFGGLGPLDPATTIYP